MRTIQLGKSNLKVSSLGFGCAKLTATPQDQALRILEAAFDEGITHFDIARLYGLGWAEKILGQFLKGKRDQVTVTTKFGLQPPGGWVKNRDRVYAVKRVLKMFPPLVKLMRRRAAAGVKSGKFTPADAQASLETSLRELGTDHVEMLLLHEAELIDAQNEPLIEFLQAQIDRGVVRCVGIGSDFARLPRDLSQLPAIYQVVQFNHNAQTRNLPLLQNVQDRALSTHTIFGPAGALLEAARQNPDTARQCAQKLGVPSLDPATINSLLLHFALHTNRDGLVLFSSTKEQHVRANAKDAANAGRYEASQIDCFVDWVDQMFPANVTPAPAEPAGA